MIEPPSSTVEERIQQALRENLTLSFVEPGDDDKPVVVRVTAAEAVSQQRAALKAANYVGEISDEECLFDYIVVNWARIDFPDEDA